MPKQLTYPNAQAALVNLDLSAVALCNEGANSRADILLIKRKENMSMSFDELLKTLQPDAQSVIKQHIADTVATETKKVSDAKDGEIATLKTTHATEVTNLNAAHTEALNKAKPAAGATEDVIKTLPPEAQALFKTMQDNMAAIVATQETQRVEGLFAKMKSLPAEEAELKSVLKAASPAMLAILEKAATAIEEGLSKGKTGGGEQFEMGGDADVQYGLLEKHAKELMAKSTGMTFEKAFSEACTTHPEIYTAYMKGVK